MGEHLLIPFFAFALGTGMTFASFLNLQALLGGLFLGLCTVLVTGGVNVALLKVFREKSQLSAVAEASTAGNAVQTPVAVAAAASVSAAMDPEQVQRYQEIVEIATIQISISTMTTAILCPVAVIAWFRFQEKQGVDTRQDVG